MQDRPGPNSLAEPRSIQHGALHAETPLTAEPSCKDEARVGQKGRTCHRWWTRGQRPPGLCDQRYTWVHVFATVRPATGEDFCLVLPEVSTRAMSLFLERFGAGRAPEEHAIMVLDQAGWHPARDLRVPANVTLVPLPPYSPELTQERLRSLTNYHYLERVIC
jgi:hypothetical protein